MKLLWNFSVCVAAHRSTHSSGKKKCVSSPSKWWEMWCCQHLTDVLSSPPIRGSLLQYWMVHLLSGSLWRECVSPHPSRTVAHGRSVCSFWKCVASIPVTGQKASSSGRAEHPQGWILTWVWLCVAWHVSHMWMLGAAIVQKQKMLLFVCERCFVVMTPEGVPLPFPLARERFCSWFFVLLVCFGLIFSSK